MDSWLKSDDCFVSPTLKIYKFNLSSLSSGPVEMVPPETNVTYGGPDGDDFKSFLRYNNFAVNRQGRAIVRVGQSNDCIAGGGGGGYDIFLLEKVVPLGKYGFTNVATPMQETLEAIRDSTKKVFVDVDLKPPAANGDPKSVLIFLKELHDVLDRQKSPVCKPEDVKFPRPRNLKQISKGGNFMDFFCRMNRTFVNEAGTYIELQFVRLASGTFSFRDDVVRYRDKDRAMDDPFQMVQCDMEEDDKLVVVPDYFLPKSSPHVSAFTTDDHPYPFIPGLHINIQVEYVDCTLEYKEFKLSGRIKRVRDTENTFRQNAPVTVFFEQSPYAKTCYVDAQASTFFVLAPELDRWKK